MSDKHNSLTISTKITLHKVKMNPSRISSVWNIWFLNSEDLIYIIVSKNRIVVIVHLTLHSFLYNTISSFSLVTLQHLTFGIYCYNAKVTTCACSLPTSSCSLPQSSKRRGTLRSVEANMLLCDIVVSEWVSSNSRYAILDYYPWERYGLNSIAAVLLQRELGFWH